MHVNITPLLSLEMVNRGICLLMGTKQTELIKRAKLEMHSESKRGEGTEDREVEAGGRFILSAVSVYCHLIYS